LTRSIVWFSTKPRVSAGGGATLAPGWVSVVKAMLGSVSVWAGVEGK
jgi:hypothetical protein